MITPPSASTFERETKYQGVDSDDGHELDGENENEGSEGGDEQVNITNDHTRIIQNLDALKSEDLVPAEFEKISFGNNHDRIGANGKTLLHHVVTQCGIRNCSNRIGYAKWLLCICPKLFEAEDTDGQTALYAAIEGDRTRKLMEFFFTTLKADCREVLSRWNKKCFYFHTAIKKLGLFMTPYLSEMVDLDILERQDDDGNTPLHVAVDVRTWATNEDMAKRVELVEKLISLCPGALVIENSQKADHPPLSPYKFYLYTSQIPMADGRLPKSHTHPQAQAPPHTPTQPLFEKNQTMAKLQTRPSLKFSLINAYMHIADRDESVRHLYGDAQDREIQFDLLELRERSKSLSPRLLKNLPQSLNHLEFECVLRYVCLPKIPREDIPESFSNGGPASLYDHRGPLESTDQVGFGVILRWLKRKMVRKIIKLTVLDDPSTPYCDEAIVKALEGIDIEVWNWYKFDLCSDTLFEAAPNAKEVTLYSTGNRAVLSSWFSKHGLKKLKNRLESGRVGPYPRDHRAYLQQRLMKHLPDIQLDIEYREASKPQPELPTSLDPDTALQDSWLECMENFAMFISQIPEEYEEAAGAREIKIAVLDDGIDAFHERFWGSIAGGISFCEWRRQGVETDGMKSHCFSSTGHGTEMAYRILQVFPKAKLYIARLDVKNSGENHTPELTAKSAAKAVLWAINQKVDIISMGWTLEETTGNSDHIKSLEKAISKANDQNILMFCAAKDEGYNQIGSQMVGSHASRVNFFFPGENLTPLSTQSVNGISGSSLATALAAGFAGLLLYCAQIGKQNVSTNSESSCEKRRKKLQNFNKMDEALTAMVIDPSTKYIPVSAYFSRVDNDFAWWGPSQDNMLNGVFDRLPWYANLDRDDE